MDDLIKAIKDSSFSDNNSNIDLQEFIVINSDYASIPLDDKNYVPLDESNSSNLKLTFIDAGQAALINSPSIAVGIIRVGAIDYIGQNRVDRYKHEFYIFVKKNYDSFSVQTFPETPFNNIKLESNSIQSDSKEQILPSSIISLIRKLSEFDLASKFINPVIDGTLEAKNSLEATYLSKLLNAIAISKTCTLTLNTGESVTQKLSSKTGSWYYINSLKNNNPYHDAEIFFAKLHTKSKYVFRIEMSKKHPSINSPGAMFNVLKNISIDPIFLGYPYGLIDVDQYVRITDSEKNYLRGKLFAKLGNTRSIELLENSINAHGILDKILF